MQKAIRAPFDAVISRELETENYTAAPIVARSLYAEQVKLYLAHFPRDMMHFCLSENFVKDPVSVTTGVARFLGLDASPADFMGSASRNRTGERASDQKEKAGLLGRILLARRDRLLNSASPAMQARLKEHFALPNAELAQLAGLDLKAWS